MNCPNCNQKTNIDEAANQYFLGKNSQGIPFFKCEECGNLFYTRGENAYPLSCVEKGYRFVPITWGILVWVIAVIISWIFGSNIITWIIGGFLLWLGWSSIKMGLFASQKLIDEMCFDQIIPLSKEAEKEWRKIIK